MVGDVHLERRHPGDGARRRADLRREVGHRREVVAEHGAHVREAITGELHAVTGIAGEPDHDLVEALRYERCGLCCHASLTPLCGHPADFSVVGFSGTSPSARSVRGTVLAFGAPGNRRPPGSIIPTPVLCNRTRGPGPERIRPSGNVSRGPRVPVPPSEARYRDAAGRGARPTISASTSTREPTPPGRWKKRRRNRPTTTSRSPASTASSHAGGSHTRDRAPTWRGRRRPGSAGRRSRGASPTPALALGRAGTRRRGR